MERFTCALFAVIIACVSIEGRSLPAYISKHVCSRNDPKLSDCLMGLIEKMRPMLAKGIPEIDVPGLEPLRLPEVLFTFSPKLLGFETSNEVTVTGRNIRCYGLSAFKLKNLKVDVERFTYTVGAEFPMVKCDADYKVDTRIAFLPVKGDGSITSNRTDVRIDAIIKAKPIERKNETHIVIKSIDLKLDIEDNMSIRVGNNYRGSTVINRGFNSLINSNSKFILESFTPTFEKTIADILIKLGNTASKNVDYDKFLPA